MHDDDNVIDLPRSGSRSSIISDLLREETAKPERARAPAAKPPLAEPPSGGAEGQASPADDYDLLPSPGDEYKAHSRAGNKPATTLHVITKDGYSRGFAWGNFDGVDLVPPGKTGGGPLMVLRFAGLLPSEVVIDGRNLGTLLAYLGQNRIGWIRELPAAKGFRDAAETVITKIDIRPVTRPKA